MGLSQEEFSRLLGFGTGVISRYETGRADPLPNQLVEMGRILQVSVDWLLGLSDDPESPIRNGEKLSPEEMKLLEKYRSGELDQLAYELLGEALERRTGGSKEQSSTVSNAA